MTMEENLDGTNVTPWLPHTLAKDRPNARPMMLAWRPHRQNAGNCAVKNQGNQMWLDSSPCQKWENLETYRTIIEKYGKIIKYRRIIEKK